MNINEKRDREIWETANDLVTERFSLAVGIPDSKTRQIAIAIQGSACLQGVAHVAFNSSLNRTINTTPEEYLETICFPCIRQCLADLQKSLEEGNIVAQMAGESGPLKPVS